MGLRGPGAKPVIRRKFLNSVERAKKPGPKDDHSWLEPGLSRAERVVRFLESLPITSGNLAGTNFVVRDWQRRDIIEPLYATDDSGVRFVREGFISMPRKQGKTALVAGLCLCHLCGPEAIQRGQCASGAADRDQAGIIYAEMCAIIERLGWMNKRIIVRDFKKTLEDAETGTTYKALSSESKTKHGLSLSFWIVDELAQLPDRKLYDVLSTATAAWPEPLGVVISTQSEDPRHIMSQLYDDAEQIQTGIVQDHAKVACIYSAPMDADPWSEEIWKSCNPALGDFRSLEEMRDFARKAKRMPALEQTFRLLYLNQRVSGDVRFIAKAMWDACGQNRELFDAPSLLGDHCIGALDLSGSGKNDLTSLILLFDRPDGTIKALPFFWAAEGGLEEAESRDRVPYRLWARQGHLITTPGRLLDYGFIAQKVKALSEIYAIELCGVDPWNFERIEKSFNDAAIDIAVKKFGQNIQNMSPAVTALENSILSGNFRHNKNPVLDWCMDNISVSMDSSGNRKFDKRRSTGRIDGAVALAMASDLIAVQPETASYAVTLI
jgi:phage terminase large subunit-like protein